MKPKSVVFKPEKYKSTLIPSFLLRLKGKVDSKKSATAVQAYVHKLVNKVTTNETILYRDVEFFLSDIRKKASNSLFFITGTSNPTRNEYNKIAQHEKKEYERLKEAAVSNVIETNEIITHVHSIVEQQSIRIRAFNDKKISEYYSVVNPDYKITYSYSELPKDKYYIMHKSLDAAIRRFAENAYNKDTEGNEDAQT